MKSNNLQSFQRSWKSSCWKHGFSKPHYQHQPKEAGKEVTLFLVMGTSLLWKGQDFKQMLPDRIQSNLNMLSEDHMCMSCTDFEDCNVSIMEMDIESFIKKYMGYVFQSWFCVCCFDWMIHVFSDTILNENLVISIIWNACLNFSFRLSAFKLTWYS